MTDHDERVLDHPDCYDYCECGKELRAGQDDCPQCAKDTHLYTLQVKDRNDEREWPELPSIELNETPESIREIATDLASGRDVIVRYVRGTNLRDNGTIVGVG